MDAMPINRLETSAVTDRVSTYSAEQSLDQAEEVLQFALAIVRRSSAFGGLSQFHIDQAKAWIAETHAWLDAAEKKLDGKE